MMSQLTDEEKRVLNAIQSSVQYVRPQEGGTEIAVSLLHLLRNIAGDQISFTRIMINSPYLIVYADTTKLMPTEVLKLVDKAELRMSIPIQRIDSLFQMPLQYRQEGDDVIMSFKMAGRQEQQW
jgi:hypothetical protein